MTAIEQEIWGNYIASRGELIKASVAVVYNAQMKINDNAVEQAQRSGHGVNKFIREEDAMEWLNTL